MRSRLVRAIVATVAVVAMIAVAGLAAALRGAFGGPASAMASYLTAPVADVVSYVPGRVHPAVEKTAPVEQGVSYRYRLYNHCGVEFALYDGRWWIADPPLYKDDGTQANPPDEWGNPDTPGTMTLLSNDRALFHADNGNRAEFEPVAPSELKANGDPKGSGCS